LVGENSESRIFAVDLNTGKREIISDNTSVTEEKLLLQYPSGFLLDESGGFLYVSDTGVDTILKINLQTKERVVVTQETSENASFPLFNPIEMMFVPDNLSELIVADAFGIMAVDMISGERRVVSSHSPSRGPKPDLDLRLEGAYNVVYRAEENDFLAPNLTNILTVALADGARSIFADNQEKYGVALVQARHMAMDAQRGRFIINDHNYSLFGEQNSILLTMDPETGYRSILADSNTPNSFNSIQYGIGFYYDGKSDYALVSDGRRDAVLAVDVINGQRVIISKSAN
jgi:hypothetical protein